VVLDDLTDREAALVAAARDGTVLVCDGGTRLRAELIRELLLGRRGELDPRGVRVHKATVTGTLDLDHVPAKAGLDLVDCVVEEHLTLSHAVLPRLVLRKSRLAGGLNAEGVRISGDLVLIEATVFGAGIRLRDAHISGTLSMEDLEARNDSGPALHADRLRVDGIVFLRGAQLSGNGPRGAVRLPSAHVGGELNMQHVELHNDSGPALDAAEITVGSNMFLERTAVSGDGEKGAIRLRGATIGGLFTMENATIGNKSGPAMRASGLTVGGDLLLNGTELAGTGPLGAVRLQSARIGNDFYLMGAKVENGSGPALFLDGLHADGSVVMVRGRICGAGDDGAIWLLGAHVAGLRLVESEVRNDSGPALFADQLQARGILLLQKVTMPGAGDKATVRLAEASVGGQFSFIDNTISNPSGPLLDVNGFSYGAMSGVDWRAWLALIRNHTKEYRPSPYQALAAVERAAGHDGNARNILIAQQHDLRHRAPKALGGWLTRRFHWLWGALAGYGYRARRTALALLVALAAAGGVSLWAGQVETGPGRYAAEHTATSAAPRTPCSTVELVGLGLDRGLPLGPTGLRTRCDLDTGTPAGQVFTVLLWVVQAAVWGLATLALAGYTGLIRKSA
jgi:hypothetical protein